MHKRQKNKFL